MFDLLIVRIYSIIYPPLPPAVGSHQNASRPRGAETDPDRNGSVAATRPNLRNEPEDSDDDEGDPYLQGFCDQNQPAPAAVEEALQFDHHQQDVLREELEGEGGDPQGDTEA